MANEDPLLPKPVTVWIYVTLALMSLLVVVGLVKGTMPIAPVVITFSGGATGIIGGALALRKDNNNRRDDDR